MFVLPLVKSVLGIYMTWKLEFYRVNTSFITNGYSKTLKGKKNSENINVSIVINLSVQRILVYKPEQF